MELCWVDTKTSLLYLLLQNRMPQFTWHLVHTTWINDTWFTQPRYMTFSSHSLDTWHSVHTAQIHDIWFTKPGYMTLGSHILDTWHLVYTAQIHDTLFTQARCMMLGSQNPDTWHLVHKTRIHDTWFTQPGYVTLGPHSPDTWHLVHTAQIHDTWFTWSGYMTLGQTNNLSNWYLSLPSLVVSTSRLGQGLVSSMSGQCDWVEYWVMVLAAWFSSGAALLNRHECTRSQVSACLDMTLDVAKM